MTFGACVRIGRLYDAVMQPDSSYVCDHCGEEIVVPIDLSAGEAQSYVEDCPVCCSPNLIHVSLDRDGGVVLRSERE